MHLHLTRVGLGLVLFALLSIVPAARGVKFTSAQDSDAAKHPTNLTDKHLVFQFGPTDGGRTMAFLYKASQAKPSVSDVFDQGYYFQRLTKLLVYARELKLTSALDFNAISQLTDGPGPFSDFPEGARTPALESERTAYADMDRGHLLWRFVNGSKLKGHKGGFLWLMPSGVMPDENWALGVGVFVRDLAEYRKEHNATFKNELTIMSFSGKFLE